jgi:uncharacterized membrane protein (UPF0127 family)
VTTTKLIINLTRGNTVCVGEVADRPLPRMRGLIGRSGLPAGEGLLLRPAPSIHTAFMRFPIDALFLDRDLRVLQVVECLGPWRMASKRGARAVLELSAGESARRGVRVGDRLELRDRHVSEAAADRTTAPDDSPSARAADVPQASTLHAFGPARRLVAVPPTGGEHPVRVARLRPLSVVIITPDHRFATVMSLLLARRNCSVTTTANAGRAKDLIVREDATVVIVDADAPRAEATIAAVDALVPPLGLLLVAEDAADDRVGQATFAKWGPFDELARAVESADELRQGWAVGS